MVLLLWRVACKAPCGVDLSTYTRLQGLRSTSAIEQMHLFTSVCHRLGPSHDGEAHDISGCLYTQEGHVLLVKVKRRVSRHMLSILQRKHSAVTSVGLVWDVCWESAGSTPALSSAVLYPMPLGEHTQGVGALAGALMLQRT